MIPHQFAEPRNLALDDRASGLGGDVARGNAGSAGGENGRNLVAVGERGEARGNGGEIVGKDLSTETDQPSRSRRSRTAGPERSTLLPAQTESLMVNTALRVISYRSFLRRKAPLLPPLFSSK